MEKSVKKPRIGYMCSYFPYVLIRNLGFETAFLGDQVQKTDEKRSGLPINLCGYVRYCQTIISTADFDGIILTNCCNAAQRLYDIIKTEYPDMFCYMLELPRGNTKEELDFYYRSVQMMLVEMYRFYRIPNILGDIHSYLRTPVQEEIAFDDKTILVFGSAVHPAVRERFREHFKQYKLIIELCSTRASGDVLIQIYNRPIERNNDTGLELFLYETRPCPRMSYFSEWFKSLISENHSAVNGVIYISSQRCDNFLFAFPYMKVICDKYRVPILNIEEEYGTTSAGQHSIRLEAFKECLEYAENR